MTSVWHTTRLVASRLGRYTNDGCANIKRKITGRKADNNKDSEKQSDLLQTQERKSLFASPLASVTIHPPAQVSEAFLKSLKITSEAQNISVSGELLLKELEEAAESTSSTANLNRICLVPVRDEQSDRPKTAEFRMSRAKREGSSANSFAIAQYLCLIHGLYHFANDVKIRNTCLVCFEDVDYNTLAEASNIVHQVTPSCNHYFDICRDCLQMSIASQLTTSFVDQLKCPMCPQSLHHDEIKAFATDKDFQKFDDMTVRQLVGKFPHWWQCPKCPSGAFHVGGKKQPSITCPDCKYQACFPCNAAWHNGMTCEECEGQKRETDPENIASNLTVLKTTKPCPGKGCNRRIEKGNGCHHVRCICCRHEFCWDCLASWTEILDKGNDVHLPTCPWNSKNIKTDPRTADYVAQVQRIHNGGRR